MDDVVSKTGFGLYNILLLCFGSLCYLSNALAYMNLPLYLPLISVDIHLSAAAISAVDFSVPIGMAVGGFFLCAVSDVVGRKTIIASSLVLIFMTVLIAAFAYGPFSIILSMILFGSGLQANLNVLKVLFAETIPRNYRSVSIVLLDFVWLLGFIIALAFYWITLPFISEFQDRKQRFFNWRVSILLAVLLSIILSCIAALILESPKYLLFERRPRDALEVLREIYAINKSKLFTTFEMEDGELLGKITDFGISSERDVPNTLTSRRLRIIFSRIHKSLLILVRKQFIRCTLLAIVFRIILSMGHFPLLMLWTRSLELESVDIAIDKYLLWHFAHPVYQQDGADYGIYRDFILLGACSVGGCIILMVAVKFLEKKAIMTSVLFLSGIFSTLLGLIVNNYALRFIFSGMLAITYSMACSCLDLIILEMFPTAVRCTALGETMIFARLASVFIIKYMSAPVQWLFIFLGCLMEVGAILAFFLPRFMSKVVVD